MAEPDEFFLKLFADLGELARDLKAIEFRARRVARTLMRRRAVLKVACADIGIQFVDQSSTAREEHS